MMLFWAWGACLVNPVSLLSLFSLLETRRCVMLKIRQKSLAGLDSLSVLVRAGEQACAQFLRPRGIKESLFERFFVKNSLV